MRLGARENKLLLEIFLKVRSWGKSKKVTWFVALLETIPENSIFILEESSQPTESKLKPQNGEKIYPC